MKEVRDGGRGDGVCLVSRGRESEERRSTSLITTVVSASAFAEALAVLGECSVERRELCLLLFLL
jgi:hypothetical protein